MRSSDGARTFTEKNRRVQIVRCAVEVLAERGYAGASVRQIAQRVGVAMSVVLYHFANKNELMESVVEYVYEAGARVLRAPMEAAGDDRARLAEYVRGCALFAWTHRAETAALGEIFANLRRADGSPRYGPADNAAMVEFVRGLLRAGQESGQFRAFDTRVLAFTLRAAIDALPATFGTDPTIDGPEYAEALVAFVDDAVTANPDTATGMSM